MDSSESNDTIEDKNNDIQNESKFLFIISLFQSIIN